MLKAIETVFDGYRFRSRLEARWAVFFKTLGIEYKYEYEGFDLDGLQYLPDFWLPEQDCWFEVKGQCPTSEEYKKARLLAQHGGKYVYIAVGDIKIPPLSWPEDDGGDPPAPIGPEEYCTMLYEYDPNSKEDTFYPDWSCSFWCECPICGKLGISPGYTVNSLACSCWESEQKKIIEKAKSICHLFDDIPVTATEKDEWAQHKIKKDGSVSVHCTPRLIAAYTAARQARFEFGERG